MGCSAMGLPRRQPYLESQHILGHHRKEPGKLKGFRKVLVVMILLEIRLVNSLWGSAHEAASVVGAARP